MITQAYYEDILQHIINEIDKAQHSVLIAVNILSNQQLTDLLNIKAKNNVGVEIIITGGQTNASLETLKQKGGRVWHSDKSIERQNPFCIIDNSSLLTGSYSLNEAVTNEHENVTIIQDDQKLIQQFVHEFHVLKEQIVGKQAVTTDYKKMLIRLETLKNVISLHDVEDINYQIKKLHQLAEGSENWTTILEIIDAVTKEKYTDAVYLIDNFINSFEQIAEYIDPKIEAMKLEIRSLEIQISSLEDEKTDIEKILHNFGIRHNTELGELIISILQLRKEKLRKEAEKNPQMQQQFTEAETEYNKYQETYNRTKDEKLAELSEEQKKELKKKFRQATKLCHPDVVAEEYKAEAAGIFNELKLAYDQNDLAKVKEILARLQKGIFTGNAEKVNEEKQLQTIMNNLTGKRNKIEAELAELKETKNYQKVASIADWDKYFNITKGLLSKEKLRLEKEM